MAEIIACRRGLVTSLQICRGGGVPAKIRFNPTFDPTAALIESVSWNQHVNVQFQPSLGGPVYVYVFGDLMGNVSISGIAFAGLCDNRGQTGIQEVFRYYNANRASQRSEVITATYGSETTEGFLTELVLRPRSPELMLTSFDMTIRTLPKDE
jgi:hypothetical protein